MKKIITVLSMVFMIISSCLIGTNNKDIQIDEFKKKIASKKFVLVDVRTAEEFWEGHIVNVINIDYLAENFSIEIQQLDLLTPVLLYCRSGNRSGKSMKIMYDLGFKQVYNLSGGVKGWKAKNNKLTTE